MPCANSMRIIPARPTESKYSNVGEKEILRRACGCVRTSEKLRNILNMFPQAPPPTPNKEVVHINYMHDDTAALQMQPRVCNHHLPSFFIQDIAEMMEPKMMEPKMMEPNDKNQESSTKEEIKARNLSKAWVVIAELVSLLQLSVTATALVLYYIIFCYMQLIYYVLQSVVYFHHADVPMKITISIVTITGIIIALNFITRMENIVGIHFR